MLDEKFVFVAFALIIFGDFTYLVDTLKGNVQPNKVSWFLWGLNPFIAFVAQLSQGIGISSIVTFAFGVGPFLIFSASFFNKKTYWKTTFFDLIYGALAVVGLVLWQVTAVGNWAIAFALISDILASMPTVVKSYKFPETETYQVYLLNGTGALITLFTLKTWDFAHLAFPMYIFLGGFTGFLLIKFKLGKKVS